MDIKHNFESSLRVRVHSATPWLPWQSSGWAAECECNAVLNYRFTRQECIVKNVSRVTRCQANPSLDRASHAGVQLQVVLNISHCHPVRVTSPTDAVLKFMDEGFRGDARLRKGLRSSKTQEQHQRPEQFFSISHHREVTANEQPGPEPGTAPLISILSFSSLFCSFSEI